MKEENAFLDVYAAALPLSCANVNGIVHAERRAELEKIKNKTVAREKYYAWRLLEMALRLRFGRSPSELGVRRGSCGAWEAPSFKISLSHSSGAVAVALSSDAVGVDIERDVPPRAENFAERILNRAELDALLCLPKEERSGRLLRLWTMKEAIFKSRGERTFIPCKTDTADGAFCTDVMLCGERYVLSVAARCGLVPEPLTVVLRTE